MGYLSDFENQGHYNGLKQLRELKESTISRWEKLGLLEGLNGNVNENEAKLFECCPSQIINEEINKENI